MPCLQDDASVGMWSLQTSIVSNKTAKRQGMDSICYDFWLKTFRDSKVRAAKDHGTKHQSRLASSFSGIVHCGAHFTCSKGYFGKRLVTYATLGK